jgi:hypothetical protein
MVVGNEDEPNNSDFCPLHRPKGRLIALAHHPLSGTPSFNVTATVMAAPSTCSFRRWLPLTWTQSCQCCVSTGQAPAAIISDNFVAYFQQLLTILGSIFPLQRLGAVMGAWYRGGNDNLMWLQSQKTSIGFGIDATKEV